MQPTRRTHTRPTLQRLHVLPRIDPREVIRGLQVVTQLGEHQLLQLVRATHAHHGASAPNRSSNDNSSPGTSPADSAASSSADNARFLKLLVEDTFNQ